VEAKGSVRALELLDSELSNIRTAQAWTEECSQPQAGLPEAGLLCMAYANAARRLLLLRLPYGEYIKWQKSALNYSRQLYPVMNKTQQERVADLLNEMRALNNIAAAHEALGEPHAASLRFESALDFADKVNEMDDGVADVEKELALAGLARTYSVMDSGTKMLEALKYHEMRLALARKLGNRRGEAEVISGLAFIHTSTGRERSAVKLYEHALTIARELDDVNLQQEVLTHLGDAYLGLHKIPRAIECLGESLDLARKIGDLKGEETVLTYLATAYGAKGGEMRRCIECYEQSLAISRKTGNKWRQFGALFGLGMSYTVIKDPRRSIEFFRESAEIAEQTGASGAQAEALYHMSRVYEWLGERERAVESSNASLKAARLVKDNEDPRTLWKLSKWNEKLKKPPGRFRRWFQSLRK
jgi:tetratricopeptide (TPR) repeat protein